MGASTVTARMMDAATCAFVLAIGSAVGTSAASATEEAAPPRATTAAAAPEADANLPWIKRMRAQTADEPVVLVQDRDGQLSARSVDGKISVRLLSTTADELVLDGAAELVWAKSGGGELAVIDLREPSPKPRPIVTGLPADLPWGVDGHYLSYYVDGRQCEHDEVITVDWNESPVIRADGSRPKARLVGRKWLAAHLARSENVQSSQIDLWSEIEKPVIALPSAALKCTVAPHTCGLSLPFGRRGWRLVLTRRQTQDDRCHIDGCLVADVARKRVAVATDLGTWFDVAKAPAAPDRSCGPIRFDPSGTHYVIADRLCSIDSEKCVSLPGRALGWLPAGPSIVP